MGSIQTMLRNPSQAYSPENAAVDSQSLIAGKIRFQVICRTCSDPDHSPLSGGAADEVNLPILALTRLQRPSKLEICRSGRMPNFLNPC